jgi:hypothetical protein
MAAGLVLQILTEMQGSKMPVSQLPMTLLPYLQAWMPSFWFDLTFFLPGRCLLTEFEANSRQNIFKHKQNFRKIWRPAG